MFCSNFLCRYENTSGTRIAVTVTRGDPPTHSSRQHFSPPHKSLPPPQTHKEPISNSGSRSEWPPTTGRLITVPSNPPESYARSKGK